MFRKKFSEYFSVPHFLWTDYDIFILRYNSSKEFRVMLYWFSQPLFLEPLFYFLWKIDSLKVRQFSIFFRIIFQFLTLYYFFKYFLNKMRLFLLFFFQNIIVYQIFYEQATIFYSKIEFFKRIWNVILIFSTHFLRKIFIFIYFF